MNPPPRSDRPFALDHLRFGPLWVALGIALVGAIVFGSLASIPPPAQAIMMHDKIVHLVAYTGLMLWFAQLFRHALTRLALALAFVALGVGIEYLQGMTTVRVMDRVDMAANAAGVLLAWALSHTWIGRLLPAFERLLGGPPSRV